MSVTNPTPQPPYELVTGHERRERDWCYRPAGSGTWLLILTTDGAGRLVAGDREIALETGDALMYRPGATHNFGTDESRGSWGIVWAHFEAPAHWYELLAWPEVAPGTRLLRTPDLALTRIERLLIEADSLARSGLPAAERLALNAIEAALLWWEASGPGPRGMDPRIAEAVRYLAEHLERGVTTAELAEHVHLSGSRLSHLFARETGMPPRRYLEWQRIARAKQLLELTSLSVALIAKQVGFPDQFYFSTRFRHLAGESPSSFRARSRRST